MSKRQHRREPDGLLVIFGILSSFLVRFSRAVAATLGQDAEGNTVGSGSSSYLGQTADRVSSRGVVNYNINGRGEPLVLRPRRIALGVSGDWHNYTATVTGRRLDHAHGPGGPDPQRPGPPRRDVHDHDHVSHARRAAARAPRRTSPARPRSPRPSGTVDLGPGSGNLSVGGKPLDPPNETTLDGL